METESLQNHNGHNVALCIHLLPLRLRRWLWKTLRPKHTKLARKLQRPTFTVPMVVDGLYANATVEHEYENHYVERGHWCNGPMHVGSEVDPDTVEVEYGYEVALPWVERLVGPHLHQQFTEWLQVRHEGWLHQHVQEYVEANCNDFEWAY